MWENTAWGAYLPACRLDGCAVTYGRARKMIEIRDGGVTRHRDIASASKPVKNATLPDIGM